MQTETLSLRISKAEIRALRRRAKAERVSSGALVRRALRAYGVTPEPEKAKTGYDVIKHLIGSCKGGPSDLSTNPKYLEGVRAVKTWVVDTGPLVALLAENESTPWLGKEQAAQAPPTVSTCDAVITEALFLLKRAGHDTDPLFGLMESGFLRSDFDLHAEYGPVRDLMRRYRDTPMSFADACLVRLAELHPEACVWTLDRDFSVYRKNRRQTLSLVTPW